MHIAIQQRGATARAARIRALARRQSTLRQRQRLVGPPRFDASSLSGGGMVETRLGLTRTRGEVSTCRALYM